MFRRHDDAVADFRFRETGQHGREIHDEFAAGMGDNRQVGVRSFCNFRFDLQADRVLFLFFHIFRIGIRYRKINKKYVLL